MEAIRKAVQILHKGGIILYPTDTIPGLGCDATKPDSIRKIFEIKNRPENKSVILLVNSDAMLQRYVSEVPELAWDLMDLSEKPTTIIYPKGKNLPSEALAADGTVAIRMIKSGYLHQLIAKIGVPLVSTSANLSGEPAPQYMKEIVSKIIEGVDFVVDLPAELNQEARASTIIKLELNGVFKIIRK